MPTENTLGKCLLTYQKIFTNLEIFAGQNMHTNFELNGKRHQNLISIVSFKRDLKTTYRSPLQNFCFVLRFRMDTWKHWQGHQG